MIHETIREWCIKFSCHFKDVLKKREPKPSEKWHLDEQTIRISGKPYILWRAVDSQGHELDVWNDAATQLLCA
ncbi:MAG: IS6 family transposase [Legionella sp.]|nr:IS6 family transposase [Legionella sp.]